MIIRAHVVISSTNPQADCAFLRDVLRLGNVDDDGYLIFGLPPAEASVHPSDKNDVHQLYLMCEDVGAFISAMEKHHIVCDPVQDEGWAYSRGSRCRAEASLPFTNRGTRDRQRRTRHHRLRNLPVAPARSPNEERLADDPGGRLHEKRGSVTAFIRTTRPGRQPQAGGRGRLGPDSPTDADGGKPVPLGQSDEPTWRKSK
jgi:hypothetical protein